MFRWLVVVLIAASPALAADKGAKEIDLGGPRRVKARLSTTDNDYRIEVRMLPVKAFDAFTNTQLNQKKARLYALQALARHLSDRRPVQLTVSGATIREAGLDGKRYALTLEVPRKGVSVVEKPRPLPEPTGRPEDKKERVAFTSSLFRARQDQENTVQELSGQLLRSLNELAKKDRTTPKEEDKAFVKTVHDLEKRGLGLLDRAADAIKNDLLLSSISMFDQPSERDALLSLVDNKKKEWRKRVQQVLAAHAKQKEKPR